jgi:hypothetical protein
MQILESLHIGSGASMHWMELWLFVVVVVILLFQYRKRFPTADIFGFTPTIMSVKRAWNLNKSAAVFIERNLQRLAICAATCSRLAALYQ